MASSFFVNEFAYSISGKLAKASEPEDIGRGVAAIIR